MDAVDRGHGRLRLREVHHGHGLRERRGVDPMDGLPCGVLVLGRLKRAPEPVLVLKSY